MVLVPTVQFSTISAIIGGISLIPAGIAAWKTGRQYLKERHITSLLIFFWFIIAVVWSFTLTLSQILFPFISPDQITISSDIFLISVALVVPIAFFSILAADFLTHEQIDPVHLFCITVLGTAILILVFVPGQNYVQGGFSSTDYVEMNFVFTGLLAFNMILGIYYSFIFARLAWKIYQAARKSLRTSAQLFLVGGIIATLGTTILTFLGGGMYIPGSVQLSAAIGTFLISIAISKEPKLFYILPSRAIRLSVITTKAGTAIFSYAWPGQDKIIDDMLFSGMVQGVSMFIQESLNKGELREILVDNATLIIHRLPEYPIAVVLIVTHPTKTFRSALEAFALRFKEKFEPLLKANDFDRIDRFTDASQLIDECIPYVPL